MSNEVSGAYFAGVIRKMFLCSNISEIFINFNLGCARFPEFTQNFSERQILWSLCSVDFHTLTLQLPIQTPHSVAPELQVSVSSLENCPNLRKTSTPLKPLIAISMIWNSTFTNYLNVITSVTIYDVNQFSLFVRKHSSRMSAVRPATVHVSVTASRCQQQCGGRGRCLLVNKFEQISSQDHQMSLVGGGSGCKVEGGNLCGEVQYIMGNGHIWSPCEQTGRHEFDWKRYLPAISLADGNTLIQVVFSDARLFTFCKWTRGLVVRGCVLNWFTLASRFTACKRSLGRVMFSQTSVISSVHGGGGGGLTSQHASQVTWLGGLHPGGVLHLGRSASGGGGSARSISGRYAS